MTFIKNNCHICALNPIFIKYFIYILLFLSILPGCVDQLPVISEPDERKLFVICEMNPGQDIVAEILILGNLKGRPTQPIPKKDTLGLEYLSLVEGDVDFGIEFEYSKETSLFSISKKRQDLKIGIPYKLRGINVDEFGKTPTVAIPGTVKIDSVYATKQIDNTYKLHIFVSKYILKDEYYYIKIKDEAGNILKPTFNKNFDAYKPLSHKPGFLVDGKRIEDGVLEIMVENTNPSDLKNIKLEMANVTSSFYEFNYFYSNVFENPTLLNNPPIAAFNIRTKTALGSFSALNTSEKLIPVK